MKDQSNINTPERPIETESQDSLGRGGFAERIADTLIDQGTGNATGVVVAVTGTWGSGKSSVLNLVEERLISHYGERVLVIRFNPWLVSNRDDLIQQFFAELAAAMSAREGHRKKLKKVAEAIPQYSLALLPAATAAAALVPHVSWFASLVPFARHLSESLKRRPSLNAAKAKLRSELESSHVSIVVLIDEVDRVDDSDVVAIAQLVRSIADFPGISYCLAYDVERVAEALGGGGGAKRGRAYLEKIVQFGFPIPYLFSDELAGLLAAEIDLIGELKRVGLTASKSYQTLAAELFSADIITTPRDIKRLVGAFRVLVSAISEEVQHCDLLAFAALQTKYPSLLTKIRSTPDLFVEDPLDATAYFAREALSKLDGKDRWKDIFKPEEVTAASEKLLEWLFPGIAENSSGNERLSDPRALCSRRALLTALRMGIVPGFYSRATIISLVENTSDGISEFLSGAAKQGRLDRLLPQLNEIAPTQPAHVLVRFWSSVIEYLQPKLDSWQAPFAMEHRLIQDFEAAFRRCVLKNSEFADIARRVMRKPVQEGQTALVAHIIWDLFFTYGLFGRDKRSTRFAFLSSDEVQTAGLQLGKEYRKRHLAYNWAATLGDMLPIYVIRATGNWDDACKRQLADLLSDETALDGFVFAMFGDSRGAEFTTIEDMVGVEFLSRAILSRGESFGERKTLLEAAYSRARRQLGIQIPETDQLDDD